MNTYKFYILKMDICILVRFLIFHDRTPLFYLIKLNHNSWFIWLANNFTMEIKVTIKCTIYGVKLTFELVFTFKMIYLGNIILPKFIRVI